MNEQARNYGPDKLTWLCDQVQAINGVLLGERGGLGIVAKVNILWRSYVWILCTLSAIAGSAATLIASKVFS